MRLNTETTESFIQPDNQPAAPDLGVSGILLFNSEPRLMYMDRQAMSLCSRINFSRIGIHANGIIPPEITELSKDIAYNMQAKIESNDSTPIEIRRLAGDENHAVLLRGFGLPNALEGRESRILILIEDVALRKEICTKAVCERFQFTDRESAVIQQLSKGYTNKQIASALDTTEQIIKEVIKRIMYKTKTATRTGILMEVLTL